MRNDMVVGLKNILTWKTFYAFNPILSFYILHWNLGYVSMWFRMIPIKVLFVEPLYTV